MLFCKEERPKIKAANPDMKFSEFGAEMGKRWKELDPLEKQKYTDLHEELRQKYNQDMAAVKEIKVSKFKTVHFVGDDFINYRLLEKEECQNFHLHCSDYTGMVPPL